MGLSRLSDPQINSLQAGRAVAALAVVAHHANLAAESFGGWSFSALNAGYLGVDFFFVLSGFIIYTSAQGKKLSEYSWARIRRVYLPYLPVGVGIALLYNFLPSLSMQSRDWSWLTTLTLLPLEADTALSVAWTLKHEILFYAVFALLFFNGALAAGLLLWSFAIIGAATIGIKAIPLALINLEFVAGICAAIVCSRSIGTRWLYVAALLCVAAWLGLGALREHSVVVGLAVALALPPTVALERKGSIVVPPWLVSLGAASYAIYLIHGLAVSLVGRLMQGQFGMILPACMAAGVLAGLIYYRLVEKPLLDMVPKRPWGRRRSGQQVGSPHLVE